MSDRKMADRLDELEAKAPKTEWNSQTWSHDRGDVKVSTLDVRAIIDDGEKRIMDLEAAISKAMKISMLVHVNPATIIAKMATVLNGVAPQSKNMPVRKNRAE